VPLVKTNSTSNRPDVGKVPTAQFLPETVPVFPPIEATTEATTLSVSAIFHK